MNELTTANTRSSLPTAPSRQLSDLVARFTSALEYSPGSHRAEICTAAAPSDAERQVLAARSGALDAALTRATDREIRAQVGVLLSAFPRKDAGDTASADALLKLYVSALTYYPAWAIAEVCRSILEGRASINTAFAPTPAQMAERCREVVAPFLEERAKISSVLTAQVYDLPTQEERERIAAGFAKLADALKRVPDDRKRNVEDANKSFVDASERLIRRQLAAAGITDGLPMSVELRDRIAAIRAQNEIDEKYDALGNAAAERRQRMEKGNGGKDEQAEGAGAVGADGRAGAGAGDVFHV